MSSYEQLIAAARQAQRAAYAPYSNFQVGAALLTASGRIFTGANIENASYGLTVCAERTAVWQAVLAGERTFTAIAVATSSEPPSPPCGACLQVLSEFSSTGNVTIILAGTTTHLAATPLSTFLPKPFQLT